MMINFRKGFTLMELLVVIAVIGIIAAIIIPSYQESRLKAKNASMVSTLSGLHAVVDASKYPGSLASVCNDFESGGEFSVIKDSIEKNGGIWNCDSTVEAYRVFVKLHTKVTLVERFFGIPVFAQSNEENPSAVHSFGNYYCVNSNFENNFTHWSGANLTYPSCNDTNYTPTVQDPVPTPEPTPDPEPEPVPEPPIEHGGPACEGGKIEVCHFKNTLCVSDNALKAHLKHGDTEGAC
jgi:prepilin-type N-terminal cleavage/methylation domain-containing protein